MSAPLLCPTALAPCVRSRLLECTQPLFRTVRVAWGGGQRTGLRLWVRAPRPWGFSWGEHTPGPGPGCCRDCGLACVLMVLQGLGVRGTSYERLRQMCPTTRCGAASPASQCRAPAGRPPARPPAADLAWTALPWLAWLLQRSPTASHGQAIHRHPDLALSEGATAQASVDWRLLADWRLRTPPPGPRPRSIWTIDLAHLLAHYGLPVCFTTITIGINDSYGNESFYMEHLAEDERRVRKLFLEAPEAGGGGGRRVPLPGARALSGRRVASLRFQDA